MSDEADQKRGSSSGMIGSSSGIIGSSLDHFGVTRSDYHGIIVIIGSSSSMIGSSAGKLWEEERSDSPASDEDSSFWELYRSICDLHIQSESQSNIRKVSKKCEIVIKKTDDDTLTNMIIVIIRAAS